MQHNHTAAFLTSIFIGVTIASLFLRRTAAITRAVEAAKCSDTDCPCHVNERRIVPRKNLKGPPEKLTLAPFAEKWICSCGKSKSYPYCDGSHKGTTSRPFPIKNTTEVEKTVYVCTCGKTGNADGTCDGSHRNP